MTKINPLNESLQALGRVHDGPGKKEKTGGFEQALSNAIDKEDPAEMERLATPALGEIESAYIRVQSQSTVVSGKTDQLLGLIDAFASQLGDPAISLKSMTPVLERMNENADLLLKETQGLGKVDSDLKDIATQTAVTARSAYIKFQRGDYL